MTRRDMPQKDLEAIDARRGHTSESEDASVSRETAHMYVRTVARVCVCVCVASSATTTTTTTTVRRHVRNLFLVVTPPPRLRDIA